MKLSEIKVSIEYGDTIQQVIDHLYDLKTKIPDLKVCCSDTIVFDIDDDFVLSEVDDEKDR